MLTSNKNKRKCQSVFELQWRPTGQETERRRPATHKLETHAENLRTVTPQWRNPQSETVKIGRHTRLPTEATLISYGAPPNRKVRGRISLATGAKEDQGMKISRTDTADFTRACRKTSPTSETEGGERESPACVRSTGRPDRPVSNGDWNPTDASSVFANHLPIGRPNGLRKTIGG